MTGDDRGMVNCPTCVGAGLVHVDVADRAVKGQEVMDAVDRLDAGPRPPGLTRRPEGAALSELETVLPCSIDPTEALVIEVGGRVAFSMLLGTQWETECAVPTRADVQRLVTILTIWLGGSE